MKKSFLFLFLFLSWLSYATTPLALATGNISISPNPQTNNAGNITVTINSFGTGNQVCWFNASGTWASNAGTSGWPITSNQTGFGISSNDASQHWIICDSTKSDWAISAGTDTYTVALTKNYYVATSDYCQAWGTGSCSGAVAIPTSILGLIRAFWW